MRLFVGVDLPDGLAEPLAAVQARFEGATGLDFTDPGQAHVTLKFLGEVDEERVPALVSALEAAVEQSGVGPFDATFGGLGVFPNESYIRVLWLGCEDGGEELTALHEAVETAAVDLGFDPADHAFTPHVTLARMCHAGGKDLVRSTLGELDPTVGTTRVTDVRVTESVLDESGPTYRTVASIPLS